jgi:CBS domain-containing protein
MEIELLEIRDFIAAHPPFDMLASEHLDQLPRQLTIRYLRRGTIFPPESATPQLHIIRSGAVALRSEGGVLTDKLGEGDYFIDGCHDRALPIFGSVVEDSLIYQLPCQTLHGLMEQHPPFRQQLALSREQVLRRAIETLQQRQSGETAILNFPVGQLVGGEMVTIAPTATIRDAAIAMSHHDSSAILVMQGEELLGLVTDRDLRRRCLAEGVASEEPVSLIMTKRLRQVDSATSAFDALLIMTRHHIHHLPVVSNGQVSGLISASDLLQLQATTTYHLAHEIAAARDEARLVECSRGIAELYRQLFERGASVSQLGEALAAVIDALTRRWIELAEAELGPAPCPWLWVAIGSLARRESTPHSDQDNALIIADSCSVADKGWFEQLAARVCDGLSLCGITRCPGEVMACNPAWRLTLSSWRRQFAEWIDEPTPKAVMLACNFFDMRAVSGDATLLEQLQATILPLARANRIFLAHLAANALRHRPPIGFFRHFVLIDDGEHHDSLDLKRGGLMPIVELARLHALNCALTVVDTRERLRQAAGCHSLSEQGSDDLRDAFDLLATLRARHQTAQIAAGESCDNFLRPADLSSLERNHLRDAFALLRTMQEAAANDFRGGR